MSATPLLAAAQRDARLRRDSGDLVGAIATLAEALDRVRAGYGEDHPEVLAAAHELARLHRAAGEPAQARRVLEEALAAGQLRFGESDPLLLAISFDLGTVAEELGNRHEARRNFTRVANAGPATLGPDHWAVRAARAYLGTYATTDGQSPSAPSEPGTAPISAPPTIGPPISAPPISAPPTTRLPTTGPPVSAPPTTGPSISAPPATGRPTSAPIGPEPGGNRFGRQDRAGQRPGGRGRGTTVAASVAAVAAVIAAGLAGVAVLRGGGGDHPSGTGGTVFATTPAVSIDGDPPTDVRVAWESDAIVLTWTDPAPGQVSFVITGGKQGAELRFVGQLPSGSPPRFPVHGFNRELDYCFQVAAVYSTSELGVAQPVCTTGSGTAPDR